MVALEGVMLLDVLWLLCILLNNFRLGYVLYCFGSHEKCQIGVVVCLYPALSVAAFFTKRQHGVDLGLGTACGVVGFFVFYVYSS